MFLANNVDLALDPSQDFRINAATLPIKHWDLRSQQCGGEVKLEGVCIVDGP